MTKTKTLFNPPFDVQFTPPHGRGVARVEIPKFAMKNPACPWQHENGTLITMLLEYIQRLYSHPHYNDPLGSRRQLLETLEPYFSANAKSFVVMLGNQRKGEEQPAHKAEGAFFGLCNALAEDAIAWHAQKLQEAREGYEWGPEEREAYEKDRKLRRREKADV